MRPLSQPQFANGSKIEDTLSKVAQRASLQSPEMATMLRTKQDLSRQIGQATEQLSFLRAGLPAETNNQQSINQTQSTLESLRRQQFDVEKQFRLRFPQSGWRHNPTHSQHSGGAEPTGRR